MATHSKVKKVLGVIKSIIVWLILILSILMMVFTIVSTRMFDRADKSLFGYKFMVVLSDSMSATHFSAYDVIIVKEVPLDTLEPGDVISFYSPLKDDDEVAVKEQFKGQNTKIVTHMIKEVTTDSEGNIAFITYGTTNGPENVDKDPATMIIGEYQMRIPQLGRLFEFVGTVPGYIVCILIPFMLLIISQAIDCVRLFRRYKKEQMAGIAEEREKLEAEREENRKMMEELIALKAQMAAAGIAKTSEEDGAEKSVEDKSAEDKPAEDKPADAAEESAKAEDAPAVEAEKNEE